MKRLDEDEYNQIKRECASGATFTSIASKVGFSNSLVGKVNSSIDFDHFMQQYQPKRWQKMQEKKRIGDWVIPDGKGKDPNERITHRIPLVDSPAPKKRKVVRKQVRKEITAEQLLMEKFTALVSKIQTVESWADGVDKKVTLALTKDGWDKHFVNGVWTQLITLSNQLENARREKVNSIMEYLVKSGKDLDRMEKLIKKG